MASCRRGSKLCTCEDEIQEDRRAALLTRPQVGRAQLDLDAMPARPPAENLGCFLIPQRREICQLEEVPGGFSEPSGTDFDKDR
jgi:hypothetical protein